VLVSQSATPITSVLTLSPPTIAEPYKGAQTTAAARASLQRALDNYKTGRIVLDSTGADLTRENSDTRSFGESHASELSSMVSLASTEPGLSLTPPAHTSDLPPTQTSAPHVSYQLSDPGPNRVAVQSPPMNPATLNQSPVPIPTPTSPAAPAASSPEVAIVPTVAETGIPVSAGENGPGPASGSLHNIHAASSTAGPKSAGLPGRRASSDAGYGQSIAAAAVAAAAATPSKFESAEDEKKRLQREEREPEEGVPVTLQATPSTRVPPAFESAEDEKKRLEREQRERILKAGGSDAGKDDEELPPYQDPTGNM
jgi:hypothetical protein